MTFDETVLPILAKDKNMNNKLIFWEVLQYQIHFELSTIKNKANKSLKKQ